MTPLRSVLAYPSKATSSVPEIKMEQDRKKPKLQGAAAIRPITLQDFGELYSHFFT
jgi:hypothetical protein